jgi:hypothetical protein
LSTRKTLEGFKLQFRIGAWGSIKAMTFLLPQLDAGIERWSVDDPGRISGKEGV